MINRIVLLLIISTTTPICSNAATYYIRPGGGDRTQCTGLADADYSGSGIGQACAWSQFRYSFTTGEYNNFAWAISGGDTIIVRGGPYRIGALGPNPSDHGGPNPGDPFTFATPPIPSGTSINHTKILGENYASCTAKTGIYAGYGANAAINIRGSQYVDIQCLDLTDHGQCGKIGNSNGCASSFPVDDYASNGVSATNGTANIYMKNVDIHGFASRGWIGHIDGDVTLENTTISRNPAAGIDLDDGSPSTGGTFSLINSIVEWNGCIEEYPIVSGSPSLKCFDQNSSGYGDAIGTQAGDQASWNIDRSIFRYNTQDGPDLLHSMGDGIIKITRSQSYGNMGQQIKLGATANSVLQNNFIAHNCLRLSAPFPGAPSGYNSNLSNFCRAAGDGVVIDLTGPGSARVENNTYVGYGATTLDINCNDTVCGSSGIKTLRNNIFIGISNPTYESGNTPGFIYYAGGDDSAWTTRDHNYVYNMRNFTPTGTDSSANPGIIGPITMVAESSLDGINLRLSESSIVRDSASAISDLLTDIFSGSRPYGSGPDVGAHEYGATVSADVCDSVHLNLCAAGPACIGAGGYWYSGACHSDAEVVPPPLGGSGSIHKTGAASITRGGGATLMRGQ